MHKVSSDFGNRMRRHGLRHTEPRQQVHQALEKASHPLSATEIHTKVARTVNAVTVYRILESFQEHGIVHRHPCDGRYTLCRLPETSGHHGFLHCSSCGGIEEFHDERLCKLEDAIAALRRFQPRSHVSEIIGTCLSCQSHA